MSHFTVMVIGNDPEKQLEPFREHDDMPRYIEYTKQQLIEEEKKTTEGYKNGIYAKYLSDPEKYLKDCGSNSGHVKYITEEFPKVLQFSDEEFYQKAIQWHEPDEIGKDGEVYSTRNPNGKWDWYVLGGRWSGEIKLKKGATGNVGQPGVFNNKTGIDQAKKGDIANIGKITTFAVLKGGKWYEQGKMGWWGVVHDEKDKNKWKAEMKKLIEGLPDETLISIYDCHV